MKLDPEIALGLEAEGLKQFLSSNRLDTPADIAKRRADRDVATEAANAKLDRSGVITEMLTIPGFKKSPDLQIRIHRPTAPDQQMPCLFFVHGGGMVFGSSLQDDPFLVPLVRDLKCVATSIEYRLAPEHRAPAATEDCYAGLDWVFQQAQVLGIDPDRIAIGGTSGGGGIAASATIMARDYGLKPCFQYLIYPQLDDRNVTPSSHGKWATWGRELATAAWTAVLGDRAGAPDVSPYEAAARATDLSGLPPTYIEVGAMEIFRDECIDYAERLLKAEVQTELHVYPGCCHGFDLFVPNAQISRTAASVRRDALVRAWR